MREGSDSGTVIRVVGVGGGGGEAVNRMIDEGLGGVDFVAINTDSKDLARSKADSTVTLAGADSRGLGAGGDPSVGREAAEAHEADIRAALKGADMVIVVCGEGGGTGTGASPVVARIARELGALTIAVVTRPFRFEGNRRTVAADGGIDALVAEADAVIVISNENILGADSSLSLIEAFKASDAAVTDAVRGVTGFITNPSSYILVDFADVKTALTGAGRAVLGVGEVPAGVGACREAGEKALASPLLDHGIEGAHSVLVSFAGPLSLRITDINTVMAVISEQVSPDAAIVFGLTLDDSLAGGVRVTIIAGGFESEPKRTGEATGVGGAGTSAALVGDDSNIPPFMRGYVE